MNEEDRQAIEFARAEFAVAEARLYEHVSSTFRWLMATLFAANGGGLIALLGDGAHDLPGRLWALCWFALGVVGALVMGSLSALSAFRATKPLTDLRVKIVEGLVTDKSDPTLKALQDFNERTRPTWKTWTPTYAGIVSLGLFIVGLATIAGSLIRAS
jgi:hypothetical protein